MPERTASNDTARDRAEVGAFFGVVAGLAGLGVVAAWLGLERLWGTSRPFWPALVLHLGNLVLYAAAGALIGAAWPLRSRAAGRMALWLVGTAAAAMTITSVVHGPLWTWPWEVWWRYGLTAAAFALVFGWPEGSRRTG